MSSDITKNIKNKFNRWRDALRNIFRRNKSSKQTKPSLAINQVLKARHAGIMPNRSQLKHLPKLLSKTEKQITVIAILLILVASSILSWRLLNSNRVDVAAIGGEYTEGLIGTPQLINPLYSSTSDVDSDLARLIFNGLMRYDAENGLVPDLTDSFEVSEDNKTYTFKIREDAKWHDGEQVRAEDVIFTISAIQNKDYRSPLEISFSGIIVEQVDEQTVRFILNEPFAPFLSLLTVGILPSHIWQDVFPLNAPLTELNKKPIGSGPYKFEKLVKDSKGSIRSYTLVRNPKYHRGAAQIEKLHFKFYPEVTSALEALRNHNIEGLSYVPLESVEDFEKDGNLQIIYPTLGQYVAAFFNTENSEILEEDLVREALALASNKQKLVDDILGGHGSTIKSFILNGMIGEHPELNVQVFDLPAAKEKLEKAKWLIPEDGTIRKKDDKELILDLVAVDSVELIQTAEELAVQWLILGIQVNIRIVDSTEFQNDILKNRNYDILLSGELYGIDPDPYAFWHSSQAEYPGLNLSGFSNRKADGHIEAARETTDPEKRAEEYRALQEIVAKDIAAIFLYQPTYSYAVSSKIQNVIIPSIVSPSDRFSNINDWFVKTKKETTK